MNTEPEPFHGKVSRKAGYWRFHYGAHMEKSEACTSQASDILDDVVLAVAWLKKEIVMQDKEIIGLPAWAREYNKWLESCIDTAFEDLRKRSE